LLAGRALTWHDDKNAPRVAVINETFARKLFGSQTNALGRYYKTWNGTRVQVVGIVRDGKYANLTEEPQAAMFMPLLQSPSSQTPLFIRSDSNPQQLSGAIRSRLRDWDSGLPAFIRRGPRKWTFFCLARVWPRWRWGCSARWAQFCRSPAFLEWRRTRSAGGFENWEFAWPLAPSGRKCWGRRWGEH